MQWRYLSVFRNKTDLRSELEGHISVNSCVYTQWGQKNKNKTKQKPKQTKKTTLHQDIQSFCVDAYVNKDLCWKCVVNLRDLYLYLRDLYSRYIQKLQRLLIRTHVRMVSNSSEHIHVRTVFSLLSHCATFEFA